jgi:hypothetical protein
MSARGRRRTAGGAAASVALRPGGDRAVVMFEHGSRHPSPLANVLMKSRCQRRLGLGMVTNAGNEAFPHRSCTGLRVGKVISARSA